MLIQKVLKRSLPPPNSLLSLITLLVDCSTENLAQVIHDNLIDWPWSKTDFFHWIGVLNRFDKLLEEIILKYELPNQSNPLEKSDVVLVLAILKLTLHLWEHATNRNLYSSYERLIKLLGLVEMDIVWEVLKFLKKPSDRLDSQKSLRAPFTSAIGSLQVFANRWPGSPSIVDLVSSDMPEEGSPNIHYQFYRSVQELKDIKLLQPDENEPKRDSPFESLQVNEESSLVSIILSPPSPTIEHILATLMRERKKHNLSHDRSFELLHKIRIGCFSNLSFESRCKLLSMRLLSLCILANIYTEEIAVEKVFLFEPDLIQRLAQILLLEKEMLCVRTATLTLGH